MVLFKVIIGSGLTKQPKTAIFVAILSALFVNLTVFASDEVQSQTVSSIPKNSTDSTAQESTVKYRRVRNNVIKYGAIYRGNSVSATRAFTRRPKASRREKHRHSTKVDTTKLPVVLLPPVITFRNNDIEIEKHDPFVINVVSEFPLTTSSSTVTNPYNRQYENTPRQGNGHPSLNRPLVDEKIMAMKNFGVRMQDRVRGDSKHQTTQNPTERTSKVSLNDYTPPPTFFPSVHKLRKVGKQSQKRRTKVRTTTVAPYINTEVSTEQTLPKENQYENSFSQILIENATAQIEFLEGTVEPTTSPAYSDFTNSSLADVLNYDIQRTSPRTIFSLDVTGPVSSVGTSESTDQTVLLNDSRYDSSTPDVRYEGSDFLSDDPVSSPGSPTTHLEEYFSNIQEVSSSFEPRTEINVATSKSQSFDSSTTETGDEDRYELKDLIYPPLNILAPPFLEDVFHDHFGNVILNATESTENSQQAETVSTPYSEVSGTGLSSYTEDTVSPESGVWNASSPPIESTSQSYTGNYEDNSLESATESNERPTQQVSSQYDCQNGDCSNNETAPRTWTNVPFSPSDVKVLSDTDGLALINRMYENLLRVLNGGPDYYDLSEEPQKPDVAKEIEPVRVVSTESSNLLAEESGDIRNARHKGRSRNSVLSGQRSSRRKEVYNKGIEKYDSSGENQQLKKSKSERKAAQLCSSKTLSYVADVSTGCKVFYVCTEYGIGEPMLCPNGTLFNQDYLVCDWWYNVEC